MLYNSSKRKRTLGSPRGFTGPKRKMWLSGCPVVRLSVCPVMTQRRPEPRIFLAEPPQREKLCHRPPHTIVHALSKFELHQCLLHCERVWRMLGPNWRRTCPIETLGNILFCSILEQFSRKLRESHHRQDLLKFFQVACPSLAGGASASTCFVRRSHGAAQHSPMLSDSPVCVEPLVD